MPLVPMKTPCNTTSPNPTPCKLRRIDPDEAEDDTEDCPLVALLKEKKLAAALLYRLDIASVKCLRGVSRNFKQFIDDPRFWEGKCRFEGVTVPSSKWLDAVRNGVIKNFYRSLLKFDPLGPKGCVMDRRDLNPKYWASRGTFVEHDDGIYAKGGQLDDDDEDYPNVQVLFTLIVKELTRGVSPTHGFPTWVFRYIRPSITVTFSIRNQDMEEEAAVKVYYVIEYTGVHNKFKGQWETIELNIEPDSGWIQSSVEISNYLYDNHSLKCYLEFETENKVDITPPRIHFTFPEEAQIRGLFD